MNKTPNLAMNLSPISVLNRSSPKEKRTFTFFRSRTLSSSSTESNSGGGGGGSGSGGNSYNGQGVGPPSPRLSPRTLFDKVRKRSQSDVKSQPSVDHVNTFQHNLQMHLQQQLQEKLFMQQQEQFQQHLLLKKQMLSSNASQPPIVSSNAILSVTINGGRKHMNHSISEENDESIINEEQDSLNQQSQNPLDILFALSPTNKLKVSLLILM